MQKIKAVGIVGLGAMGSGMCENLIKAGYCVHLYDISADAVARMETAGGRGTPNCKALAERSDVVITVLNNEKIVENVLFGPEGLAEGMKTGQILLECSTISVLSVKEMAARAAEKGIVLLDAPVSGGPEGASAGTLSFMIGGDEAAFETCQELFECMGREIAYMGASGNGQLTKLINQLLYDVNAAALAEILPFGVKMGLDPTKLAKIVNSGTGRSFASQYFIDDYLNGNFSHGYKMGHAYKDLVNAAAISYQKNIPMPLTAVAGSIYQQALCKGFGDESKAAMIKVFEELDGVFFRAE